MFFSFFKLTCELKILNGWLSGFVLGPLECVVTVGSVLKPPAAEGEISDF